LDSADVIIIGGGIVGSSIAYHLTEAGCRNVLVIERETHQGKGSTGKSMGGVRAQFATPINIRMSLYSIPFFAAFDEVMGHPSGYRPQGYLFVATTLAQMDSLRENYRQQVECGLKAVSLLDAREVSRIAPELRSDDIIGGSFCATDGFVDPHSVMTGFMLKAAERGVRLMRDTDVTGIAVDQRGVTGVETSRGFIAGRTVVNACAACWCPPSLSTRCRTNRPWWSTWPPASITDPKASDCCWRGTIPRKRPALR
jgi:sarcosine oxidase subunit beta